MVIETDMNIYTSEVIIMQRMRELTKRIFEKKPLLRIPSNPETCHFQFNRMFMFVYDLDHECDNQTTFDGTLRR